MIILPKICIKFGWKKDKILQFESHWFLSVDLLLETVEIEETTKKHIKSGRKIKILDAFQICEITEFGSPFWNYMAKFIKYSLSHILFKSPFGLMKYKWWKYESSKIRWASKSAFFSISWRKEITFWEWWRFLFCTRPTCNA